LTSVEAALDPSCITFQGSLFCDAHS